MIKWLALSSFISFLSCSESTNENAKPYQAGFTTIHLVDTSRIYKPNTDESDYLHYRPIDIDIWYPAYSDTTDTLLSVRSFLSLLETRANYYSASNMGNGVSTQLAQFFCDAFKCSDTSKLLSFKTNSFRNSKAAEGKFPFVVYMTAFNGMSYENFTLCEELAKKGFMVASISSIGRFPGDMTMKTEDLIEQVNDALIGVMAMKENPNIDFSKIGIVGYSWGGLAGSVLAGKMPDVKCLVSLEGSEFHHYGYEKNGDADFDSITKSDYFKTLALSIPYLRLESAPQKQSEKKDSVYRFYPNNVNNAQILAIDSMRHEDFDCFSFVVKQSGNCPADKRYLTASNLTISFLEDKLKNGKSFSSTVKRTNNITKKE